MSDSALDPVDIIAKVTRIGEDLFEKLMPGHRPGTGFADCSNLRTRELPYPFGYEVHI